MATAPYTVTVGDRAGLRGSIACLTWTEALKHYRAWNAHPGTVAAINGANCEHDGERWHDGLTEDEREEL